MLQHPSSGVDRLIQIAAVPEPDSDALMLAGLAAVGAFVRLRAGSERQPDPRVDNLLPSRPATTIVG